MGCKGARGPMCGTDAQVAEHVCNEIDRCLNSGQFVVGDDENMYVNHLDYWVLRQAKELLERYEKLLAQQSNQTADGP